jgi:hypothetical protein
MNQSNAQNGNFPLGTCVHDSSLHEYTENCVRWISAAPVAQLPAQVARAKRKPQEIMLTAVRIEEGIRKFIEQYDISEDDFAEMQALIMHGAELENELAAAPEHSIDRTLEQEVAMNKEAKMDEWDETEKSIRRQLATQGGQKSGSGNGLAAAAQPIEHMCHDERCVTARGHFCHEEKCPQRIDSAYFPVIGPPDFEQELAMLIHNCTTQAPGKQPHECDVEAARQVIQLIRTREEKIRRDPPAAVSPTQDVRESIRKIIHSAFNWHDEASCVKAVEEIAAWHTASLAKAREEAQALQHCLQQLCEQVEGVIDELPDGEYKGLGVLRGMIRSARALRLTAPGRDSGNNA